jgi:Protein of unknown function (DUF3833)
MDATQTHRFGDTARLEEFFLGSTRAKGVFQDRFGKLRRRFIINIDGSWQGREFIMAERFLYDDGQDETRTWRITALDAHTYEGRADDVLGVARGIAAGPSFYWNYVLALRIGERRWPMRFNDSFVRVGGILINRARMSKYGIFLGEATVVFLR